MKSKHTILLEGKVNKAFNYVPSWETMRPGYLAEKFKKIQRELKAEQKRRLQAPEQ